MSIQDNIRKLQEAHEAVRAHCMCARFKDDGAFIVVTYPEGDWPDGVQGVQAGYLITGKTLALTRILDRMERDWKNSFPGRG